MSDDRWKGDPLPSPRPWEPELKHGPVTPEDWEAFLEWHARKYQCGKYRPKPEPQQLIDLREPDATPTTRDGSGET